MQVTSMVVFFLAAVTGALAAPGHGGPPPPPPPPPPTVNNNGNSNSQSISCGNGASPYCCSGTTDTGGKTIYKCSNIKGTCNTIAVCCTNNNNQNNQGSNNGGNANQVCNAFGDNQVVFV